jgi:hypothetical protein
MASVRNKLIVKDASFESDFEHHDVRILYPKNLTVEQALQAGILLGGEFMIHDDYKGFASEDLEQLEVDWQVVRRRA